MARNYVRTITDMERYYYGAGNAMGYSYSGSELLKADSPMLSTRWYIPSNLRTQSMVTTEPRVQRIQLYYLRDLGTEWMESYH